MIARDPEHAADRLVRALAGARAARGRRGQPALRGVRPARRPAHRHLGRLRARLRGSARRRRAALRPQRRRARRDRRRDPARPARRADDDDHRRLRPARGRHLVRGADERRPHRRVLRPARLGRRGDGLPQHRELAADALPRARVVLDQPLHPLRDRPRAGRLARGRAQVPDRRRLRLGDAALRLGARLRRDRAARVPRDRPGRPAAGPEPRRAARARARADDRRARLQGLGGAVPHVDAGRLRGRADAGDGVHVGRDEGGRARRDAARAHDRLPAGGAPLDDRDRRDRLRLARGREPGGARADERQADARLLLDLARRLHADRDRREQRARRPRAPLLPDPVLRDVGRLVRGRRRARARAEQAGDDREPGRLRLGAAAARRRHDGLHARLRGLPADRRLRRQVLRLLRRLRPRLDLARSSSASPRPRSASTTTSA